MINVSKFFLIAILLTACSKKKPVAPDTVPPLVKNVFSFDTTRVLVSFNEEVKPSLAIDTMNYLITSYETLDVHNVEIDPMKMKCILVTAPQESTLYEIDVRNIEDLSGNKIKDTTLTFLGMGLPLDSIPPTVHIIQPEEGDTLYGFEYFSVNASDITTGIKKVSFYINDSLAGEDLDFPYFHILDVRNLIEGNVYKIYAVAEDYGHNVGYSESLDVFIGYHPPFPYVVIDTVSTGHIPLRMDITDDGKKIFFTKIPIWPYSTTSELVLLNTETNTTDIKVSLDPPIPIYFLDIFENDWVYFTNGDSFSIYDIPFDQITETVDIGGTAQGIVRANDEKLYIARSSNQDVLVYSLQANSITDSIPLVGDPHALAVDMLHNEVYACMESVNAIAVIDIGGDTVTTNISLSENPYEVIFAPDYSRAYVSEMDNNSIAVIDPSNHTVLNEIYLSDLINPKGMAITDNGEYLFVTCMPNKVLVINTSDYSVEWSFGIGSLPCSAVFSPLYGRVYVVCQGTCEIYCIGH